MVNFLKENDVYLDQTVGSKEEGIRLAGKYLVENGYVKEEYIGTMLDRENMLTTYIGNDIAIPHGTEEGAQHILTSGVVLLKMKDPVPFGEEGNAKFIIGIAGKDGNHMDILSNLAIFCSEIENVNRLYDAKTKAEILEILGGK